MAYTKLIRSGDLLEAYEFERPPLRGSKIKRETRSGEGYRKHRARHFDNVGRLVRRFRRIVRANLGGDGSVALLTLTMYQKLPLSPSCRLFTKFAATLRLRFGRRFRYIAVPEFQERGAVHFHVILFDFDEKTIEEEGEVRRLQRLWQFGFVDCIKTDGSAKLAGYLSKYMSKAMHDVRLGGEKAYYCSRNILRPVLSSFEASLDELTELGYVSDNDILLHNRTFPTKWLGRANYKRYKSSKHGQKSG